jgi:toxin ParE1/3/4
MPRPFSNRLGDRRRVGRDAIWIRHTKDCWVGWILSVTLNDQAAREEGFAEATWYGSQEPDLQARFLAKWKDAENRMPSHPELYRCFDSNLRKCRFDVFPYTLVFRVQENELQVIAVMHMSRRPGYWKERGDHS